MLFALLVSIGAGAAAQDAAQPQAPAAGEEELDGIDEIIVRARKKDESIQDVPLSVSAFGAEAIENIAPTSLRDFDGLAPNVFIGKQVSGSGISAIYIRGQGYSDVERLQAPPVGVLIDNVFLGSSTGQLLDTFDIEQVEISRGPQSVLFGKNTTAGMISVRRRSPELDGFGGAFKATFGNYDGPGDGNQWSFQGVANIPIIVDELALRVGYIHRNGDGYAKNELTGANAGDPDWEAFNAKLLWQPNEDFRVLLNWDWSQDRGQLTPQDAFFNGDSPFITRADRDPGEDVRLDSQTFSMEVTWHTDFGTFESVTAYVDSTDKAFQDFDGGRCGLTNASCFTPTIVGTPHPELAFIDPLAPFAQLHTTRAQQWDQFSQELRWSDTFMEDRLELMVGGYLWHHDYKLRQTSDQVVQTAIELAPGVFLAPTLCPFIGLGNGTFDAAGNQMCLIPSAPSDQLTGEKDDSWSIFASATFAITEQWNVSVGARHIDEEKEFNTRFQARGVAGSAGVLLPKVDQKDSWDDTVFEASTDYHITEDLMVYASYGEGFRSGGFSARGADPLGRFLTYEPETSDQFEIGVRSSWADGKFVLNLSAFSSEVESAQGSSIVLTPGQAPGTNTFILNSGTVETEGIELETHWYVIEGLRLYGIGGYQTGDVGDSEQLAELLGIGPDGIGGTADDGNAGPSCAAPAPPGSVIDPALCMTNLGGAPLVRTPKLSYTLGATYTTEIGPGTLVADIRWKHQDDIIFTSSAFGSPFGEPEYNLLDSTITYSFEMDGNAWTTALVLKNITNEEYVEQALSFIGFQTWGPPRYIGIELGAEF
jgi:iron complex outermembrane receptor protein